MSEDRYCSFCGKGAHEVKKLIVGPAVQICDECTALCASLVVAEEKVGIWYVSTSRPADSKAIIKEIIRELREEDAASVDERLCSRPEGSTGAAGASAVPAAKQGDAPPQPHSQDISNVEP